MRKNTNQTTAISNTARPVLIVSNAKIEGPGSACRASVADSTICPLCFVAIVPSLCYVDPDTFQLSNA